MRIRQYLHNNIQLLFSFFQKKKLRKKFCALWKSLQMTRKSYFIGIKLPLALKKITHKMDLNYRNYRTANVRYKRHFTFLCAKWWLMLPLGTTLGNWKTQIAIKPSTRVSSKHHLAFLKHIKCFHVDTRNAVRASDAPETWKTAKGSALAYWRHRTCRNLCPNNPVTLSEAEHLQSSPC